MKRWKTRALEAEKQLRHERGQREVLIRQTENAWHEAVVALREKDRAVTALAACVQRFEELRK